MIMGDSFYFLYALLMYSAPFVIVLWFVRKIFFLKQFVLFLFLLILPFGFAIWVVFSPFCRHKELWLFWIPFFISLIIILD